MGRHLEQRSRANSDWAICFLSCVALWMLSRSPLVRATQGCALVGAWLDYRMARADGAIYLRVGWPHSGFCRELRW